MRPMAFAYGVMDPVDLDKPLPHSTRFARFRPTGADSHPGTGSPGPDAEEAYCFGGRRLPATIGNATMHDLELRTSPLPQAPCTSPHDTVEITDNTSSKSGFSSSDSGLSPPSPTPGEAGCSSICLSPESGKCRTRPAFPRASREVI